MSRSYEMNVNISKYNAEKSDEICEAANKHWNFTDDSWSDNDGQFNVYGEGSLCGGESEEDFTQRITKAIWKANGGFCMVEVRAVYLDDLPCEYHQLDEDSYEEFVTSGEMEK